MFVADLTHYLDMPDDVPGPARRVGEQLGLIVRAATAGTAGQLWTTAVGCSCRPARKPCPGFITVVRTDIPATIRWQCGTCGDEGVISGWEQSSFDLRFTAGVVDESDPLDVRVTREVAITLQGLQLSDNQCERLVFQAVATTDGDVIIAGTLDSVEELAGYVAAEANHEDDRRRQKRLDVAFEVLETALRGQ